MQIRVAVLLKYKSNIVEMEKFNLSDENSVMMVMIQILKMAVMNVQIQTSLIVKTEDLKHEKNVMME